MPSPAPAPRSVLRRFPRLAALVVALAAAATALVGLNAPAASAATTDQSFVTFYGWWDNTPPGGDISYPEIHQTAGGTGTYSDPITYASYTGEFPAGTIIYVPRVQKYFIMEDSCEECQADWTGKGPDGGPNLRHVDLWLGGQGGNAMAAIDCEDALTHSNADGTPTLEPIIVGPPSNETVSSAPLFNTSTGQCYGNAQPVTTVGTYKNGSNGQCLDDPGDSSSSGVKLVTKACNGTAEQVFSFHGAFLVRNNLCADYTGGSISLRTCTAGPSQQWSVNPNGTISDIQTGKKCVATSGTTVVSGSCSGSASQWTFTASGGTTPSNDFSVAVSPTSGSVTLGNTVTATVSTTVTSGSAQSVALTATGGPTGSTVSFSPASVNAGSSSTLSVATTASTTPGTYTITVKGTAASGSHTATYSVTVSSGGGTTCTPAQLLTNAGFESGSTGWTTSSTLGFDPITNDSGQAAHGGSYKAWFNGNGSTDTDTVAQTVTIPSGCHATLSYWQHIDTTENTTTAKPDTFKVQVLNSSGTVLATLATFSNLDKNTGYAQKSYDLSAYAGQTVTVKWTGAETDANGGTTNFVIDDTAVQTS